MSMRVAGGGNPAGGLLGGPMSRTRWGGGGRQTGAADLLAVRMSRPRRARFIPPLRVRARRLLLPTAGIPGNTRVARLSLVSPKTRLVPSRVPLPASLVKSPVTTVALPGNTQDKENHGNWKRGYPLARGRCGRRNRTRDLPLRVPAA